MNEELTRAELISQVRALLIRHCFQLLAAQPRYTWKHQDKHEAFVQDLLTRYPCVQDVYAEHMEQNYDELLLYVFLADLMYWFTMMIGKAIIHSSHEGIDCWKAVLLEFESIVNEPGNLIQDAVLGGFAEPFYNYCRLTSERLDYTVSADDIAQGILQVAPPEMKQILNNELPETLRLPAPPKPRSRKPRTK